MKKTISVILISIFTVLNCLVSNAESIASMEFTANTNNVDINSEITIYLKLNGVFGIESLRALDATLEYDKEVFQLISVTGEKNWIITIVDSGRMSAISQSMEGETSGNIMKIVLKAIKKPESGTSDIKLRKITLTDSNIEEAHEDISYQMNIRGQSTSLETPDVSQNLNSTNKDNSINTLSSSIGGSIVQNNNSDNIRNNNTNSLTAEDKATSTGLNIAIIILIILALIIGTASIIRYKNLK